MMARQVEEDNQDRKSRPVVRARNLMVSGEPGKALAVLEPLISAPKPMPAAQLLAAKACIALEQTERAEGLLKAMLSVHPDKLGAHKLYLHLLEKDKREAELYEAVENARRIFPDNEEFGLLWARLATVGGFSQSIGSAVALLQNLANTSADQALAKRAETTLNAIRRNLPLAEATGIATTAPRQESSPPTPQSGELLTAVRSLMRIGDMDGAVALCRQAEQSPELAFRAGNIRRFIDRYLELSGGKVDPQTVSEFETQNVLFKPDQHGDTLIVLFSGLADQLGGMPRYMIDAWLSQYNVHRLYIRDQQRLLGMAGIVEFGKSYAEALDGIRAIAEKAGARRVGHIGISAGGYTAIRYGLDLGASFIFTFGAPTSLAPVDMKNDGRARIIARRLMSAVPDKCINLRNYIQAMTAPSPIINWYGGDHAVDRVHAENLAGLANADTRPLDGVHEHSVLHQLILSDELDAALRQHLHIMAK